MRLLRVTRLRAARSLGMSSNRCDSDGEDGDYVPPVELALTPRPRRTRATRKRKRSEALEFEPWEQSKKIYQPPAAYVAEEISTEALFLENGTVDLTGENSNSPATGGSPRATGSSIAASKTSWRLGQLVSTPFGLGSIQGIHERSDDEATSGKLLDKLQEQGKLARQTYLLPYSEIQDTGLKTEFHSDLGHYFRVGSPIGGLKDFDVIETVDSTATSTMTAGALKRKMNRRKDAIELTILRPDPTAVPEIEACLASAEKNNAPKYEWTVYEVWLQWGDGCHFPQFHEPTQANGKAKKSKETYDSTWMPKVYLSGQQLKPAEDTVLAKVELYKEADESVGEAEDKFMRRRRKKRVITLTMADYCRLWPGVYLNDTLFDFYVSYILEHHVEERLKGKIHVFNSLFYKYMSESPSPDSVLTWSRGIDVFNKHFVILPVNDGLHWSLAVICNPRSLLSLVQRCNVETVEAEVKAEDGVKVVAPEEDAAENESATAESPVVLFLDSLKGNRTQKVLKQLRRYLQSEVESKLGGPIEKLSAKVLPGFSPAVPEQQNQCDCGLYALEFFQRLLGVDYDKFLEVIKLDFGRMRPEFAKAFGAKWFSAMDVARRRHKFAQLLRSLKDKRQP